MLKKILFALTLLLLIGAEVKVNASSMKKPHGQPQTISISFVFDTTSSMSDVLQQMRRSVNKIFDKIESIETGSITFNYVLVLFNDPGVSYFITEDKEEFSKKMWEILVYGGGDCPENSLTGLSKAIEVSSSEAHIFLLTDADSKEKEVSTELDQLIQYKKPKIYFILTGKCYDDYDPVYQRIADQTKGHLFIVPESEVETLLNKFVANLVTYRPPSDESSLANLTVVPLPTSTPPKPTSMSITLKIDQFPDTVYEYDELTLHCSMASDSQLTTGIILTLMRDNVTVAEKFSTHMDLYNSKQVMVVAFNVQKVKLSDAGVYICHARPIGAVNTVISTTKLAVTVHKRQVRQRKELVPVEEMQAKEFHCNLNGSVKWERNHVVLSKSSQSLRLNANEVKQTRQLSCFSHQRNANTVDKIIFDILIGGQPQVDIKIENATTTMLHNNRRYINCFVKGRLVTYVQLFDADDRVILDTSRHGGLIKMSDDSFKVTKVVNIAEGGSGVKRYRCMATSMFGVGSKTITLQDNKTKTFPSHQIRHQLPPEMLIERPTTRVSRHDIYGAWSSWSICSGSCGTGYRTRNRKCRIPSPSCTRTLYEVEVCQLPSCSDLYRREAPETLTDTKNNEAWMGRKFEPTPQIDYDKNIPTTCPSGYSWDLVKRACVDIDECHRRNVCPRNHRCLNKPGSYLCTICPTGYTGVKHRCLDINECSQNRHNCDQICINLPGSFACKCQRYYELQPDGFSCVPEVL